MKTEKYHKKKTTPILIFCGVAFSIIIVSLILISSNDRTKVFFGTLIGISIMAIVMLVLGVAQFIPQIFKGRGAIKAILLWIMGLLWLFMSSVMFFGLLPDFYKDIPNAINAKYSNYEGILTTFYISDGKSTRTYFKIDDREFKIDGEYSKDFLQEGEKYRVEYLPHSKFTMQLYKYRE